MENFKMKFSGILAELVFISLLIFIIAYFNIVHAQYRSMPGPSMVCGKQQEMLKFSQGFYEKEFMVLQESRTDGSRPYYIFYRNEKSGTWTIIAYNVPNAPSGVVCVISGGLSSYILPDLPSIKKMLDKQQDGLDTPIRPTSDTES